VAENKIRILHIVDSLNVGGMENGIINITKNLDKNRFKTYIACMSEIGVLAQRLSDQDAELIDLRLKEGICLNNILKIRKLVIKNNIDVVFSHNFAAGINTIIATLLTKNVKVIHGEHGRIKLEKFKRRLIISKYMVKFVSKILYVSQDLANYCEEELHFPKLKREVIINGVDSKRFSPEKLDEKIRHNLGIAENDFVIGMVGRFFPLKNHQLLIKILPNLLKISPNIKILFIGDGSERLKMEKLSSELNIDKHILFIGNQVDIEYYYPLMNVHVLPSIGEGTSNVILEAMSSGRAVVATNIKEIAAIINKEYGFLFIENDEKDLIKKLKRLIEEENLCKNMGMKARETILNNYSITKMSEAYSRLFTSLVKNNI
jgi:glycosyltransferase involved in cell wall biosynthesis